MKAALSALLISLLGSSVLAMTVGLNSATAQEVESSSSDVSAASGSNRFIVWSDETYGSRDILFRRSPDNGASWKPTVNLSKNPGASNEPFIAVSGSNVYVIWTQGNNAGTSYDIFFRRSTDNGNTWQSKVNLSSDAVYSFHPRMAVSGSSLNVVWDNGHYRRSSDNGATWKSVQDLGCISERPKIAVSGNKVYVAAIKDSYLLCRSTDGGVSWKSPVTVFGSGKCPGEGDENFSDLAASGTTVFATCNPAEFTQLALKRSTDSGASWSNAKELFQTGMSFGHVVAVSGSTVFVVGTELTGTSNDDFGVLQEIFMIRSTDLGATWKTAINISNTPQQSSLAQIGL